VIFMLNLLDPLKNPYPAARAVTYASRGMVATSQHLAAQAGLDILKKGGNAVDAAIATAAALTLVEPCSNGIGSDAFAIVWMNNKMYGLNSSGPAPMDISLEAVKDIGHDKMPTFGWTPVTVPGTPAAWAALSKRFGKLSLRDCLQPAIQYAEEGFVISPAVGAAWQRSAVVYKDFEYWQQTFGNVKIGQVKTLPDHAKTLAEIADTNAESFYTGRLAEAIDAASRQQGGYLRIKDLENYKPRWVNPISVNYRGYDVWEIPPNGQGIVALMALNILKHHNFESQNAESYHKQFEAIKMAFAVGKQTVTDPYHMKLSPEELLAYADKLEISDTATDPVVKEPIKGGTVYLATADDEGNMVSYIQSNYMGFGSGIVIPGTGIAMQNRGCDFSLDPNHANCLEGGKRSYHTIIPGFLTKDGEAIGPFGVMGGYMQPQGHVQVIMNSIDFHLNPQAALDAPRWQWTSDKNFMVESHFPADIARELVRKGHQVHVALDSTSFGRGQIIWRNNDVLIGGTESRTDSAVVGW